MWSHRDKIIRCPNCRTLLTDNQKTRSASIVITLVIMTLWAILTEIYELNMSFVFVFVFFALLISSWVGNFSVVRKDLVIRNILTKQISYINKADWEEIVRNNGDKDNVFEIIEEL
jgi:hypothetical protein